VDEFTIARINEHQGSRKIAIPTGGIEPLSGGQSTRTKKERASLARGLQTESRGGPGMLGNSTKTRVSHLKPYWNKLNLLINM